MKPEFILNKMYYISKLFFFLVENFSIDVRAIAITAGQNLNILLLFNYWSAIENLQEKEWKKKIIRKVPHPVSNSQN